MSDPNISYLESASWDEGPMRERMRWLRDHAPLYWSELDQLWVVSRFADVEYVSKHQEIFTSGQGVRAGLDVKIGLIDEEEPRHGQLRKMINRGFTPRMVNLLAIRFRELTTRAIDAVADKGECDFVKSISVPLPLWIIASMMGIREQDYERFRQWSDAMIHAEGNQDDPAIVAAAAKAYVEYATYVTGVIQDRRENPQEDLVSILANAKDEGLLEEYDEDHSKYEVAGADMSFANDELIKLLVILLVAGNETTRNAISGGMQLLIENPDERQRLLANPGLLNSACEEMIRLTSPVHSFSRTVLQDTELHGQRIEAGQKVLMLYPSANRDERVFADADTFRVDRNPSHLGFGIGSHFCLGANLARMEMRVCFEELLRRLPDMEYADGGPVIVPSALVRNCQEMKVRYTPESRAAA
ncbi:MAG: cytochrome P450 [Myxococcota bacterium]|nr:cytochrome P450 [Myxococcota bacterium]